MNYAYVSLLSSDDYIMGIIGLNYSLDKMKCKYPFIVIVTQDISTDTIQILKENNIQYRIVNTIHFPDRNDLEPKRYTTCANKLYLYTFTDFDKIMFIDADCIIIFNIDFMFEYPTPLFYASNFYTDKYPAGKLWGGLFVVEPNVQLFKYFLTVYQSYKTDEEFLNEYYQRQDIFVYKYHYYLIHEPFEWKYWYRYNLSTVQQIKNFLDYSLYKLFQDIPYYANKIPHQRGVYELTNK